MPIPAGYKSPFFCNENYHLLFKSLDGLLLFRNDLNRKFFLERFSFFLRPVLISKAYCQLDNHVHFVVQVKDLKLLYQSIIAIPDEAKTVAMKKFLLDPGNEVLINELIARQTNRFMVSYANSYNSVYNRRGGLFQSPFRRSVITGENHLRQAIIYVHANAQKHRLISNYRNYPYSSYHEILSGTRLFVDGDDVLRFFGGAKNFVQQHQLQVDHFYANRWPSFVN
jgi:putative transposase